MRFLLTGDAINRENNYAVNIIELEKTILTPYNKLTNINENLLIDYYSGDGTGKYARIILDDLYDKSDDNSIYNVSNYVIKKLFEHCFVSVKLQDNKSDDSKLYITTSSLYINSFVKDILPLIINKNEVNYIKEIYLRYQDEIKNFIAPHFTNTELVNMKNFDDGDYYEVFIFKCSIFNNSDIDSIVKDKMNILENLYKLKI